MKKRVIGYTRVSSAEQRDEGVSLDAQAEALRSYCALRGLELVELVTDPGVSAGKPLAKREGGRRVLAAVAAGDVDGVVATKLDRLFRSTVDCLTHTAAWDAQGVALHLLDMGGAAVDTSTAMGRLFLTMLSGVAEFERAMAGERTKAALAHVRSQGVRLGRVGLGLRRADERDEHGRLVIAVDHDEHSTVERIHQLRADGCTLRAIAQTLTSEGRTTQRGGRWHASTVRGVLARLDAQTQAA